MKRGAMGGDRLQTVLRLRELVEQRRLAEHAGAERELQAAVEDLAAVRAASVGAGLAPGTALRPSELGAARLGALAHADAADHALRHVRQREERREAATALLVATAVERRSVERLIERREAVSERAERQRDARRADDVALQIFRRNS